MGVFNLFLTANFISQYRQLFITITNTKSEKHVQTNAKKCKKVQKSWKKKTGPTERAPLLEKITKINIYNIKTLPVRASYN